MVMSSTSTSCSAILDEGDGIERIFRDKEMSRIPSNKTEGGGRSTFQPGKSNFYSFLCTVCLKGVSCRHKIFDNIMQEYIMKNRNGIIFCS